MSKTLRQQLEEICTYHSDLGEGTSGYLLNNDQFDKIEQAVLELIGKDERKSWGKPESLALREMEDYFPHQIRNKLRAELRKKVTGK